MPRRRTVVLIPAFNESEAIPAVLADLASSAPDLDVVVIDDGSTDGTAAVARATGATVLSLPFNLGIGGALRLGFRWAHDRGYDTAVQLDADGQHDTGAIAALLAAIDDGADLVIGNRFGSGSTAYAVGHTRGAAMRLLRGAVRLLSGRRFEDTSSGFRAFSRPVLEHFARRYPIEYLESVESLVQALDAGFDVREIEVDMRQRQGGEASSRQWRLAYHYLRLLIVLGAGAGRRRFRVSR